MKKQKKARNKRAERYMGTIKSARAIRKDKVTETGDIKPTKDQGETSAKQWHKSGDVACCSAFIYTEGDR